MLWEWHLRRDGDNPNVVYGILLYEHIRIHEGQKQISHINILLCRSISYWCLGLIEGYHFSKKQNVLSKDLVKYQSRAISCWNNHVTSKFGWCVDSYTVRMSEKSQRYSTNLNQCLVICLFLYNACRAIHCVIESSVQDYIDFQFFYIVGSSEGVRAQDACFSRQVGFGLSDWQIIVVGTCVKNFISNL